MPWTGEPETEVTRMTFTEWMFALAPKREVQIGYSVRVQGTWELFGNEHALWKHLDGLLHKRKRSPRRRRSTK